MDALRRQKWSRVGEPIVTEAVRLAVIEFHCEALNLYAKSKISAISSTRRSACFTPAGFRSS